MSRSEPGIPFAGFDSAVLLPCIGFRYSQLVPRRSGPPRSPFLLTSSRHAGRMQRVKSSVAPHSWKIPESIACFASDGLAEFVMKTFQASATIDQARVDLRDGDPDLSLPRTRRASGTRGNTATRLRVQGPDTSRWPLQPARAHA